MIHEDFGGAVREVRWGELQAASNRFARVLREHGVEKGDRVAMLLPPTPETAAAFFGTFKCGAILLSMSVLYGDEGSAIACRTPREGAPHRRANAGRIDPSLVEHVLLIEDLPAGRRRHVYARGHARRRPGAALLLLRHDRAREGDPARAPLPARARGVRLLPRRARRRALPRHGGVGVGGGHRAAVRAVAARRRPARLPARGRLRPAPPARRALAPRRDERVHDADRDALDDGDRRRGHALPAAVPRGLQRRRAAQPRGDPLVPRAVRRDRARLLRLTESYPLVANYPFMEVREGSMGKPMPGWDVADPRRGRAAGREGERGEICLRARSNPHYPLGYWRNDEAAREAFGGEWFHTKDAASRDADGYVWYEGRADDVIIAAGYRIGPFEVESACLEHPAVAEAAAVASPDERRGNVVKAFIVAAAGARAVRRARGRDQGVRARASRRARLPAPDRVHRRAAEDADGQDPPHRAAPAGGRAGACPSG